VISRFSSSTDLISRHPRLLDSACSCILKVPDLLLTTSTAHPVMRRVPWLLSVLFAIGIATQACPYSQVIFNRKLSHEASLLPRPPRYDRGDPDCDMSFSIIIPRVHGMLVHPGHTLAQHQAHTGIPDRTRPPSLRSRRASGMARTRDRLCRRARRSSERVRWQILADLGAICPVRAVPTGPLLR
jgi:hypothetical protein